MDHMLHLGSFLFVIVAVQWCPLKRTRTKQGNRASRTRVWAHVTRVHVSALAHKVKFY